MNKDLVKAVEVYFKRFSDSYISRIGRAIVYDTRGSALVSVSTMDGKDFFLNIFMANDKEFWISRYEKKDYYCLSKKAVKDKEHV